MRANETCDRQTGRKLPVLCDLVRNEKHDAPALILEAAAIPVKQVSTIAYGGRTFCRSGGPLTDIALRD